MNIHNSWPMWMTFIGGFLAAIGALLSAHKQSLHEQDINKKNQKIIELQGALHGQITGGDSFARATLDSSANMIVFMSQGKYPIYDLIVDVVDAKNFRPPTTLDDALSQREHLDIGNLYPHSTKMFRISGDFIPTEGGQTRFNLFFVARNGYWRQTMTLVSINSRIVVATQVTKGFKPEEVLYEQVDEDFPRDMLRDARWVDPEP